MCDCQRGERAQARSDSHERLNTFLVAFLAVFLGLSPYSTATKIYWADPYSYYIRQANPNGTGVSDVIYPIENVRTIAIDDVNQKIYWIIISSGEISRANLDGSGIESLVEFTPPVTFSSGGMALDLAAGKMYWSYYQANKIGRANLDGTGVEDLASGLVDPIALEVDSSGRKLYWTDRASNKVRRADLDGTNIEDLYSAPNTPTGIALNVAGGKVYWLEKVNGGDGIIRRANLDGTGVETFLMGPIRLFDIALDVSGGKMYLTAEDDLSNDDSVQCANLDSSEIEEIVSDLFNPLGIAIGPTSWGEIWVDFAFEGTKNGSQVNPYDTLAQALGAATAGSRINLKGDTTITSSDEILTINQAVTLQAFKGTVRIGDPGLRRSNRSGFIARD